MSGPVQLILDLASGRADALSGRFLTVFDDLDALLARVDEIGRENLYSLRVSKLDAGRMPAALAEIMSAGERWTK
jgi:hypothetical protein